MAKAKLPETQTHTGGSHSLPTPDKEQHPHDTRSYRLNEPHQPGDGAGNKPDNGRTGRLHVHDHHDSCTTGSPTQETTPARRRSLHSTQRARLTPGAASRKAGRSQGITDEQSEGKARAYRGKGDSQNNQEERFNGGQPMLTDKTTSRTSSVLKQRAQGAASVSTDDQLSRPLERGQLQNQPEQRGRYSRGRWTNPCRHLR